MDSTVMYNIIVVGFNEGWTKDKSIRVINAYFLNFL